MQNANLFTEAERVTLYNDLCDLEEDYRLITYPSKTKEIDVIRRAIRFVRGNQAKWEHGSSTIPVASENSGRYYINCTCSACGFELGHSNYRICPNCGSRMRT